MPQPCEQCEGWIYGNYRICNKCRELKRKKKKIEEMQGIAREMGNGKPTSLFIMPFLEIHHLCGCTWVWDTPSKKMRLKYMTSSCAAASWHKSLRVASMSRTIADIEQP